MIASSSTEAPRLAGKLGLRHDALSDLADVAVERPVIGEVDLLRHVALELPPHLPLLFERDEVVVADPEGGAAAERERKDGEEQEERREKGERSTHETRGW